LNVYCSFPTKLIGKYISYLLFYIVEIGFLLCSYLFSQQNLVKFIEWPYHTPSMKRLNIHFLKCVIGDVLLQWPKNICKTQQGSMGECKLHNSNKRFFHQGKRFNWLKLEPKSKFITKHIDY